jgi:hypothetical protein
LFATFWRRQLYSRSPRLGQTNGDRLLWRAGTVFAFPNVFDFFAHKLARLSGRRLAFALIFARAFNWFFFWHNKMISPLTTRLDVINNAGLWKAGNSRQLSSVPVAFRADLRVSDAKKFGVTQMPTGKRSRVGMFSLYFSDGRKEDLRGPRCNQIPDFRGANALTFASLSDF